VFANNPLFSESVTNSSSRTYLAVMGTELVFSVIHAVVNTSGECRLHDKTSYLRNAQGHIIAH
jgi:hypothetical protein